MAKFLGNLSFYTVKQGKVFYLCTRSLASTLFHYLIQINLAGCALRCRDFFDNALEINETTYKHISPLCLYVGMLFSFFESN